MLASCTRVRGDVFLRGDAACEGWYCWTEQWLVVDLLRLGYGIADGGGAVGRARAVRVRRQAGSGHDSHLGISSQLVRDDDLRDVQAARPVRSKQPRLVTLSASASQEFRIVERPRSSHRGRRSPYVDFAARAVGAARKAARFGNFIRRIDVPGFRQSVYFQFSELNTGDHSWALIRQPLIVGAGTGYGLDKWRENYGGSRIVNSAYRNPVRNANVGGAQNSRHMYGDASDLRNNSVTQQEWDSMVTAAENAFASWIEPVNGPCGLGCTHADWRYVTGGYQ